MKRLPVILSGTLLAGVLLSSCSPSAAGPTTSPVAVRTPSPQVAPTPTPPAYVDVSDLTFSDLSGMVFTFSSGAGAWSTQVEILPDGTFTGCHSDADMGASGPDYPNGTYYECAFSGTLSSLTRTGDYAYSMTCDSITQEGTVDEVVIEDGRRCITSYPYGFDDVEELALYLPGKKLGDLPQSFLDWVGLGGSVDADADGVLPFYGLYNVAGEQGFRQG